MRPSILRCAAGTNSDACLTDPELAAITEITSDSVLPNGVLLSRGIPLLGQQDLPDQWSQWFNKSSSGGASFSLQFGMAIAQVLTRDPTTDGLNYNPNLDIPNVMNLSALTDAWPGDLSAFGASKGKVIIWDGTTSIPVPYTNHIEYYKSAAASLGGVTAAANTMKMYFLPGVDHCGGGNGAGTFNFLKALDSWVDTSTSPDGGKVQKLDVSGTEILSRPLCAYPQYPRYVGPGPSAVSSSFVCSN
jgi:feruloyl esterase